MFCLIQIQCGRVNNALSNELIDRDDKSEIEELNPKYIEGTITAAFMFENIKQNPIARVV